ncbi:MAG: hypothetical protein QOJ13_3388 [Gaiellales bacterium]|jgi:hypothetical protein|nr:hypothetical protein [Gaiellales bacterium]
MLLSMRAFVVVTLLGSALAAGCGGGAATSTPDVPVGQFTQRANAICVAFDKSIKDLGTPRTLPQLVAYFDRWKPKLQAALVDMRRVPVPLARSDRFHGWVDDTSASLEVVDQIREAAARGDAATVQTKGAELDKETKALDGTARSLGLRDCTG